MYFRHFYKQLYPKTRIAFWAIPLLLNLMRLKTVLKILKLHAFLCYHFIFANIVYVWDSQTGRLKKEAKAFRESIDKNKCIVSYISWWEMCGLLFLLIIESSKFSAKLFLLCWHKKEVELSSYQCRNIFILKEK